MLSFHSTPLQGAYGDFLADSVLELARSARPSHQQPLEALATILEDNTPWSRQKKYAETYKRAREILSQLPGTNSLTHALDDYSTFEKGLGPGFPSFPVATTPAYDRDGEWSQLAVDLAQDSKCRGSVAALNGSSEQMPATIARSPRVVDVELTRLWLSDTLLDARSGNGTVLAQTYFSDSGSLRLIPSQLWILMEDKVTMELDNSSDQERLTKLRAASNCCSVVCDSVAVALKPDSIRAPDRKSWSGLVDHGTPILFAIVSRRRMAER